MTRQGQNHPAWFCAWVSQHSSPGSLALMGLKAGIWAREKLMLQHPAIILDKLPKQLV